MCIIRYLGSWKKKEKKKKKGKIRGKKIAPHVCVCVFVIVCV